VRHRTHGDLKEEKPTLARLLDDAVRHRALGDPKEEEPPLARLLDHAERKHDLGCPEKQCRRPPCCSIRPNATVLTQ